MSIYIGIDQSVNSTGVTVIDGDNTRFYLVKSKPLTKREAIAADSISCMRCIVYQKLERDNGDSYTTSEMKKLKNHIEISNIISSIVTESAKGGEETYIAMEGVSFGSTSTNSIVDLAMLSAVIRCKILEIADKSNGKMSLHILTPSEVKKFASGNGTASKEILSKMFLSLFSKLSAIKKVDDLADSFWIASYIREMHIPSML